MPRGKRKVTDDGEFEEAVAGAKKKRAPDFTPSGVPAALASALAKIGVEAVTGFEDARRISTGSLALDWALGGGWIRGRINTILGESFSGKTTTVLLSAKRAGDAGFLVAYFDMEGGADPRWLRRIGCDPKYVHLYRPDTGEKMLAASIEMIKANVYDILIFDSIGETAFTEELAGDVEDAHVGLAARRYRLWIKKVKPFLLLPECKTAVLVINQTYNKVGGYSQNDTPSAEYGGRGLGFAAQLKVKMGWPERKGDLTVFTAKTIKNRSAPLRECSYTLDLTGKAAELYHFDEVADIGKIMGVFTQRTGKPLGAGDAQWYYGEERMTPDDQDLLGGKKQPQRTHAVMWLSERPPEILQEIETEIRRRFETEDYEAEEFQEGDEDEFTE